jgi:epoxide hydrolase 4
MTAASIRKAVASLNGIEIHYAERGTGELVIFLHGFPEFWYAWRRQLEAIGESHHAVAVDMRGYNLSSKPHGTKPYRAADVAKDIVALADHLGARKFSLVGHDWGGVIAWRIAADYPDRLDKLVIINAPHPAIMKRELLHNSRQRRASSYILFLRLPGVARVLKAFDFKLLRPVLERGLRKGYFDKHDVDEYLKAWSQPGAIRGSVAYYKSVSAVSVFRNDKGIDERRTSAPTLVIWGERDRYLLPGLLDGLDKYVDDLTVHRVPDASHWIVHEKPALINSMIRGFLSGHRDVDQKFS